MFTEVRQSRLRTEEKINRILTTWVKVQRALDIVSTVVHGKLKVSEIPTDFDEFVGK